MKRRLDELSEKTAQEGVSIETSVRFGSASESIIEMAKDSDHNMIALTTHGRSGVGRLVVGSATESIVRESGDPVLVIPPSG